MSIHPNPENRSTAHCGAGNDCSCGHPWVLHADYGGCYVMVCRCRRDRDGLERSSCPDHEPIGPVQG